MKRNRQIPKQASECALASDSSLRHSRNGSRYGVSRRTKALFFRRKDEDINNCRLLWRTQSYSYSFYPMPSTGGEFLCFIESSQSALEDCQHSTWLYYRKELYNFGTLNGAQSYSSLDSIRMIDLICTIAVTCAVATVPRKSPTAPPAAHRNQT